MTLEPMRALEFKPCSWPLCQSDDGVDHSAETCMGYCLAEKIRKAIGGTDDG